MRIDGPSPIPLGVSQPIARETKAIPGPEAAPTVVDHVETHPKAEVNLTNILVEMQPGNIVVYKFIDEASGRLIQQIPSEAMLNLSQSVEGAKDKKRS